MKKILVLATIVFAIMQLGFSQQRSLYYLTNLRQVIYTNPARMSNCGFSMSLPATPIDVSLFSNPLKYNNLFSKDDEGTYYIDFDKIASSLQNTAYIDAEARASILGFGIRYRRWYFNYDYSLINQSFIYYPKSLFEFLSIGNSGQNNTVDLSELYVNQSLYFKSSLSAAYRLTRNLNIGLALNHYRGLASVNFNSFDFVANVSQDQNYPLTITTGYNISFSGPVRFYYQGDSLVVNPVKFQKDSTHFYIDSIKNALTASNTGWGIDLGVVYKPFKFLEISASLLDLGYIKWKYMVTNFISPKKTVYFDGVDLLKAKNDSSYINRLADSILQFTKPGLNHDLFKSSTYPKLNLGLALYPTQWAVLGFNYRAVFLPTAVLKSYNFALALNFMNGWTLAGTYTIYPDSYNNFGFGLATKLGPVQLYVLADNMSLANFGVSFFTNRNTPPEQNSATLWVKDSNLASLMFGINFNFGCFDRTDYGLLDHE